MGVKRTDLGKVIGQVGGFRVRQKQTLGQVGKTDKRQTLSTEINIFTGKTKVEGGFKNKEVAIARAKELQLKKVK